YYRGRLLIIENKSIRLELNCRKGLAIHKFYQYDFHEQWIYGTVEQGALGDSKFSADFFSGNLTFDKPFLERITDLQSVRPTLFTVEGNSHYLFLKITINTPQGSITKWLQFNYVSGELRIYWDISQLKLSLCVLRFGFVTLNHECFANLPLLLTAHNGGLNADQFDIGDFDFDHGAAVNYKTTCNNALGMTENALTLGYKDFYIRLTKHPCEANVLGMGLFRQTNKGYLCRTWLSAREIDDTAKYDTDTKLPNVQLLSCQIEVVGKHNR
ncbi:MAG: hypothetical protein AAGB12_15965, partial [Pseudomonadota bacterium]